MKLEFGWNKPIGQITAEKSGGEAGALFLASSAKRLMNPYVPAKNLVLAQNVRVYAKGDRGYVHYLSPYAHYQYMGKLYVDLKTKKGAFTNGEGKFWSKPGISKVPTGKKLEYDTFRHPLATSHWDKAMMIARKEDLVQSYQDYLDSLKSERRTYDET